MNKYRYYTIYIKEKNNPHLLKSTLSGYYNHKGVEKFYGLEKDDVAYFILSEEHKIGDLVYWHNYNDLRDDVIENGRIVKIEDKTLMDSYTQDMVKYQLYHLDNGKKVLSFECDDEESKEIIKFKNKLNNEYTKNMITVKELKDMLNDLDDNDLICVSEGNSSKDLYISHIEDSTSIGIYEIRVNS